MLGCVVDTDPESVARGVEALYRALPAHVSTSHVHVGVEGADCYLTVQYIAGEFADLPRVVEVTENTRLER